MVLLAGTGTAISQTTLVDVDFGSASTQTGAAVLGAAGDTWNALTGTTSTIKNTANVTLSGVGLTLTSSGVYPDPSGTTMDTNTTALMEDYAYGNGSTVTVSLTGLAAYNGYGFTLVVYGAGDTVGQGDTLHLTAGATAGNSGSTLITSATSRQISAGTGVAYQIYTGMINAGTLTFTATGLTTFAIVNGFQLQLAAPSDPGIATQPVSQTTYLGQTNYFSVTAVGSSALSYQWQATNSAGGGFTNLVNSGPISGVTSNVLTIAGVTTNWALAYQVVVTDANGSVTSTPPAVLMILPGTPPLRLMPLGDSITRGATDPNGANTLSGFRDEIYVLNTNANVNFRFVGATTLQSSPQLIAAGQQYHNGFGSYTTGDLYSNLTASVQPPYGDPNVGGYWMTSGSPGGTPVQADVVILLSGANDIYWNGNNGLQAFTNNENNLLGWFKTNQPGTKVIVATDIPRNDSYSNQVLLVNQWITNAVPTLSTNFSTIDMYHLFIDASGAWKTAGSPDGIYLYDAYHPSHNGYVAMGKVWFNAIQGVVNPKAPNFITATPADSKISLTWSNVPGALGYNVKMSLTNGGPYSVVAANILANRFTNTGLLNGSNYNYVVSTVLASGESPNSYQVNATPKSAMPAIITIANGSFESDPVVDGSYASLTPAGWTASGPSGGVVAVVNPGASDGRGFGGSPSGLDGSNYCQIYSTGTDTATVYQDTGYQYQAGATYTLTAAFGEENSAFPAGTLVLYNASLGVLAAKNITAASLGLGTFKDFSVTYTANGTEGDIVVGFNITGATNATAFDFDNVRLGAVYPVAPTITTQPASQTNFGGGTVSFNVVAAGQSPLSYQWQAGPGNGPFTNLINGAIISGANSNTLTLAGVTTNWALSYQVIVTNGNGSVTSTPPAVLTFLPGSPPFRLMPLGDSITRGSTDPNYEYDFTTSAGYRDEIYTLSTNGNVNFLFVGAATKQASPQLTAAGQQHHNGYGSYTTGDLFTNLTASEQPSPGDPNVGGYWMTSGTPGGAPVAVDVVTLLSGANDIGYGGAAYFSFFTNNEINLLTWFKNNRPNTKIIVATDLPRTDSTANNNAALAINQWITNTVPTLSTNFSTTDLYHLFIDGTGAIKAQSTPDGICLQDGVHPSHNGYLAMGQVWFNAIQAVVNPTAPNFLSATGGINSQVTLSWTNAPGALGYNVKMSTTGGGPYSLIASNISLTSFTNNGLANGTTYYYVVSAVYSGGEGQNSYQVSATPGTIPIVNHSFDNNYVPYSSYLGSAPAGWTFNGPGNGQTAAVVFPAANDTRFTTYPVTGLDGLMYAQIFVNGTAGYGSLYLNTGYNYAAGATYKLTAGFGREAGTLAAGAKMMLQNPGFTTFAATNITTANTAANQFTDVSTTYTANGTEGNIVIDFAIPTAIAGNAFFDIDNVRLTVVYPGVAPAITTQPVSQTNGLGGTAAFKVVAAGQGPLSYQWQANNGSGFTNMTNGGIVSGATNNTLVLTGLTTNWALAYRAIVSNSFGSVTSSPAALSVTLSTTISIPIANWSFEAQPVTAASYVVENPTSWSVVGPSAGVVAMVNPAAGDNRFTAYPPPGLDGVNYCQVYSTGAGNNATVYQDTGVKYQAGATYTLTAYFGWEASAAPSSQLVLYNSSLTAIASNSVTGSALAQNAFSSESVAYTATGNEGGNGDIVVGFNTVGAASGTAFDFDNVGLVGVYPPGPVITNEPGSQTTYSGQTVSFSVGSAGPGPLIYQWQATNNAAGGFTNLVNGGQVSGATTNVLTITNASSNWALAYQVVVTDSYGSVTSNPSATLTVLPGTLIPIVNPNFDVDTITGGNAPAYQIVTPTGWTAFGTSGTGLVGLINPPNSSAYPAAAAGYSSPNAFFSFTTDGSSNPGISQTLTTTLNSNTTYTVSVQTGNRTNGVWGGYHILLETTNGTVVGDWVGVYTSVAAPGTFATTAKSYTTGPNPPGLGQPLVIVLEQAVPAAGSYSDFDSVSMVATPVAPRAQGAPMDVYVCSGQSNCHGWYANVAALSLGNQHYANAPDARALDAYQCALVGAASYSTGSMGQLAPEGAGHVSNFTGFGPELSAGSDLAARFGRPLAVIKFASGGANLDTQFRKAANYLYPLLIAKITNSLQQLTAEGYTPILKGFFWLQGETDAGANPTTYTNDIAQFVSDLRNDLQVTNLEFVLTEINSNMPNFAAQQTGVAQVNGGMLALVNSDPNVKYVTTHDITNGFADNAVHYTADQTVTIGQRWAAAYFAPPASHTNAYLTTLALNPPGQAGLTSAFASGTFSYGATNAYINSPTLTVTNADLTATNQLIFNSTTNRLTSGVASTPLTPLPLGVTNVVQVQVTAQDGVTKQTYTVNVMELPNLTTPRLTNSLSNGTLTLSWPADHLGFRLLLQTNNLNLGVSPNLNDWGAVTGSTVVTTTNLSILPGYLDEFYRLVYP